MGFLDLGNILGYDEKVYNDAIHHWDSIAKPLGSMGEFEPIIARLCAIGGEYENGFPKLSLDRVKLLVFAADNGVVDEGISQTGRDVTRICAEGIAEGKHSVAVMADLLDVDTEVIDVGMESSARSELVKEKKVRACSRNFMQEPAMTLEEAETAIRTGISLVKKAKDCGYELVCIGEMGIGNTTTATAVACSLMEVSAKNVTGRGAGLDDARLKKKINVIQSAIDKYDLYGADAMKILCSVGGYDIAAMVGAFIGGAIYKIAVVMDGSISATAAYMAEKLMPGVKDYIIPSHMSREPIMEHIMDELELRPVIDGGMALGEGTGAVLMISLLRCAGEIYNRAALFEERAITPYEHMDSRGC